MIREDGITPLERRTLTTLSGSTNVAGNTLIATPASGRRIQLSYLSYNPEAPVEVGFRFGNAGTLILRNKIAVGGSIVAKDFGDLRSREGAVDEPLNLYLSDAVATIWNAHYIEV